MRLTKSFLPHQAPNRYRALPRHFGKMTFRGIGKNITVLVFTKLMKRIPNSVGPYGAL